MASTIVLPNVDSRQEVYEQVSEMMPDHSTDFIALLKTLPLDKATLRHLENVVCDWVANQDHAAFNMGYLMGMAANAQPVMGLN